MNSKRIEIRILALAAALSIASICHADEVVVVMAPTATALTKDQVATSI
jgi:hypothetical protein